MLSAESFGKKQIVFIFFNAGEKLSFSNDNLVVRRPDGTIKFQCTCYRLFVVFAVGHGSITDGLILRAKKFGFSVVWLTPTMRPIQTIGFSLEGNTLLRRAQYEYDSLDIAKHLIRNKIANQRKALERIREKSEMQLEAIGHLKDAADRVDETSSIREIMGVEGSASRVYFTNYFNNTLWTRRAPRTKIDMPNALLDIGYTILFSFLEALLACYGFDLYHGVLHRSFYMRKSLVCDLMEPFRVLVDAQVRKAINLKQCSEEDFLVDQNRYLLKWEKNGEYVAWLAKPVLQNKQEIHKYVQSYYRAFMKGKPAEDFPLFEWGTPE